MNNKRHRQKAIFSAFVIWTILSSSFSLPAQNIVTSEDFSGSSVFVFRKSKPTQVKASFSGNIRVPPTQRSESRRKARRQASDSAVAQRLRTPKIDPNTVALNRQVKQVSSAKPSPLPKGESKEKTSIKLTGAAETFLDNNQLESAIDYFQQAVELDPKNESARLGLSEAYARKGNNAADKSDTANAIKFYESAVKYNDKNAAAFVGLAEAYETSEADDKAIQNYERAVALNEKLTDVHAPLGLLYFQKGDIANADKYLSKAAAADASNADVQYYLGLIRYKQNKNEEAIAALKQSLRTNPDSAEAHYYLGETYDRLNRDQEALAEYNRAVQINPDFIEAWFDLGAANYNRGRYEDAVTAYKQVLKLKNDNGEAHANLADVFRLMAMKSKDQQKKRELYGLASGEYGIAAALIKNEPQKEAEIYSNWGFVLGRMENWGASIERLNKANSLSPAAADYSNIGWANLNSGLLDKQNKREAEAKVKFEKGKSALQKAVELDSNLSAAFVNLGMLSNELGEFRAAVNALTTALKLRGDYWVLDHELGYAYRQLSDLDNAVKYFRKTTELNGDYADGWYNLGEAEYLRGNKKEAKEAYDKLKKLNPNLANRLDAVMKGAILTNPKDKLENKVREKNPLKKIPKIPF